MAGVLTLGQYLGGPDDIKCEQVFPSQQQSLLYNFNQDITGWTFRTDVQTLIVDTLTFNRNTGEPNFADSNVIGSFAKTTLTGNVAPAVVSPSMGTVQVFLPANMYTGPIVPDARQDVPVTVVAVTWTDASAVPQINSHRWALIQSWEPGVAIGDPKLATGYTAMTLG